MYVKEIVQVMFVKIMVQEKNGVMALDKDVATND